MANYLIIGATTGIGAETANKLIQNGHEVWGTFHTSTPSNSSVHWQEFDVMNDDFSKLNLPEQIDGLVYCPGSIQLKPFERFKSEDFLSDFQLQVTGAIKIIQGCLPKLKQSPQASVVLFSTVAVKLGFSFHAQVSTSKGAIEGLTKALAAEYAPKVRFNAIAPSLTQTKLAEKLLNSPEKIQANAERHPMKRVGEANDLANMVTFLLSPDSSWMTGQIISVDGGMSSIK